MSTSIENESHKSPEVLEQEIEAKRQSISSIVDSLESRFTPGQLVDQALSYTKGHGGEFFQNLGTTLKNNPVPTALTSLGLAWLAMNQNKPFNPGPASNGPGMGQKISNAYDQVSGALSRATDSVRSAADSVQAKGHQAMDKASDLTHRTSDSLHSSSSSLSDSAHHAGSQINAQASQLKGQFSQAMKDQPLVMAAIGIALGAAIGAALPPTRQEDKLFGKASDKAVSTVKSKGSEAYSVAKEHAESAVQTVKSSASNGGGSSGSGSSSSGSSSSGSSGKSSGESGTDLSAGLGVG